MEVCLILTDRIAFLVLNSMLIADEIGEAKKVQEVVRVRVKGRVEPFDDAHARFIVEVVCGTKQRITKSGGWHKIVSADLLAVDSEGCVFLRLLVYPVQCESSDSC